MTTRRMIRIAILGMSIYSIVGCGLLGQPEDEGSDEALALIALATAVVPPQNCEVTSSSGGGGTTTGTRVLYTASSTEQEMFTDHGSGVNSTSDYSVLIQVNASVGTRLEIKNFAKIGTSSRVISAAVQASGCPTDLTTAPSASEGTHYSQTDESSSPRYIDFLQAGTYQIQIYTGTGTASPGAPQPIDSSDPRPTVRISN